MIVLWMSRNVKVDIVIPNSAFERVKGLVEFNGCTYNREVDVPNTHILKSVTGSPAAMSSLFKALESLEWDAPEKIYIFVKPNKGGKKNGKALGGKADEGSKGGAVEGADPAAEYGQDPGVGGDCAAPGVPGAGDLPGIPETDSADNHCDQ